MLINDLTLDGVVGDLVFRPFLLTCDAEVDVPAVTIIDADDAVSEQMAKDNGYPIISYKNEVLFFPNGWRLTTNKTQLIKTKLFQLMKKFYKLQDVVEISDNIRIHIINDWCENESQGNGRCAYAIFLLLSTHIYGGALKKDWFLRYNSDASLNGILSYYTHGFFLKWKLSSDLVYLMLDAPKDKMIDFYFYEQDFCGTCKVTDKT